MSNIVSSGALIYRVMPPRSDGHKLMLKCGHAAIMMVTFIIMVIGLQVSKHPDIDDQWYSDNILPRVRNFKFSTIHFPGGLRQPQLRWPPQAQHVHPAQLGGAHRCPAIRGPGENLNSCKNVEIMRGNNLLSVSGPWALPPFSSQSSLQICAP